MAVNYYQKALEIYGEDDAGRALTLMMLGQVQCAQGEYAAAMSCFTDAQALSARIGNRDLIARAWTRLGHVHFIQSDYPAATSALRKALEVQNQDGYGPNMHRAAALAELGMVHACESDYDSAVSLYRQALEIYEQLRDQIGKARVLLSLGEVQKSNEDYGGALSSYREAQEIFKQSENPTNEGLALQGLGEVHRLQGQYANAMSFYIKAHALCRQVGSKLNGANILFQMAETDRSEQRHEVALERFEEAKTAYMEMNLTQRVSMCEAEIIATRQEIEGSGRTNSGFGRALARHPLKSIRAWFRGKGHK